MQVGEILDNRFELLELVGRGGMGNVFKARDRETAEFVAIKTLLPQLASDPTAADELRREVRLGQKLRHPHIVAVHDYRVANGVPFILMEFIEGRPLHHYQYDQPQHLISVWQFPNFAKQILDAVGFAHAQGVVHRDLKPANIMVQPAGQLKLLDFGIASALKATYTRITGHLTALTIQYASPEQIYGADPASSMDIYSLGCVFYEMLAGRPPFHQGDIPYQHVHNTPKPIPSISKELNKTVLECLAKSAEERPPTTQAVWESLAEALLLGDRTVRGVWSGKAPTPKPAASRSSSPAAAPQPAASSRAIPLSSLPSSEASLRRPSTDPTGPGTNLARAGGILIGVAVLLAVVAVVVWNSRPAPQSTTQPANALEGRPSGTAQPVPPQPSVSETGSTTRPANPPEGRPSGAAQFVPPQPSVSEPGSPKLSGAPSGSGTATTGIATDSPATQWARIPAGVFEMGCVPADGACASNERPSHTVTISRAFQMMTTEVTVGQFRASGLGLPPQPDWSTDGRQAVVNVTWDEAGTFCSQTGGRLPTEAEREYAARGRRSGTVYPWGNEAPTCEVGPVNGARTSECGTRAVPVGTYAPNGYGLFDVAGNVWEWVVDWYDANAYGPTPSLDPEGPSSGSTRVVRGGSWRVFPWVLRVSVRHFYEPDLRYDDVGFRCVRDGVR